MFPEGKTLSGKKLVPQMAVGCFLFAILGLMGTFGIARLLKPYFSGKAAELAQRAQARERSKGN